MSLVAWYPFNNNYVTLKDQSFSGNDLQYLNIANNISSSSNGLLGSCARRTLLNTSDLYRAVDKVDLGDEFTFACWVYPTECHVGTANGVVTNHSHVGNTGSGITLKYISATDFRLSCNTGTGTSRTYHTYYGTTNIYNKWSHVAVRYKDGEFTLWVNGVIELTFAYAQYNVEDYLDIFNWSTTNSSSGSYRPVCRINDVRVYDHAISTREMKELARGRFLHYTFEDHFYGSKQNINRTWSIYAPYATLISRSDSHWEVSELRAGNTVIAVNNGETFAVGQRVRISGYMTINGTPVAVTNATTYATTESIENDPETGWFSTVEVFDSAATWLFHAPYGSLNIGDIVRCDGIVIEKLSADTGTYSVVKDHSGYGNDSVTLTNLVPGRSEVDTGKGLAAGKFTSDSQVQIPQINRDGSTLTLTGWVNLSSYSSSYSPLFDYPFYLHVNYAGKVTSFWYNTTPAGYHTGVTTVPLNTWTMISATWDGVNAKIYVNGVLDKTVPCTGVGRTTGGMKIGYSDSSKYLVGKIAEASMYGIALSAEDLLDLYQSRGSLDDHGNMMVSQLSEFVGAPYGNNLCRNGTGNEGNNDNFPSFYYDASQAAFYATSGSIDLKIDDYIEIESDGLSYTDTYKIEAEFKQPAGTPSRYFFYIACYDKHHNIINHSDVAFYANTKTVTTQTINDGDTYIYVDDLTNWWDDGLDQYVHAKTFACWPIGVAEYPPYTYAEHTRAVRYVDKALKRLTLNGAWSGGTVVAGSPVINSYAGGTYSYIGASNVLMTTDWIKRSGSTGVFGITAIRPGTKYIKVGFLLNRDAGTETSYIRNVKLINETRNQSLNFPEHEARVVETGVMEAVDFIEQGNFPAPDYLDYDPWVIGSWGSQGVFTQNGATVENQIIEYADPWGNRAPTWFCNPGVDNSADGGWNATFSANHTDKLRFSVWVKRTGSVDGNTYLGCWGGATLNLLGTVNGNPYFWSGDLPTLDEWYLLVGELHASDYTGGYGGVSGVYDMQGNKVITGTDYKWSVGGTQQQHRAYLYYATLVTALQYFVYPRVDIVDGSEPTIQELVNGGDSLRQLHDKAMEIKDKVVTIKNQFVEGI